MAVHTKEEQRLRDDLGEAQAHTESIRITIRNAEKALREAERAERLADAALIRFQLTRTT